MWGLIAIGLGTVLFLGYLLKLYSSRNDNFWKERGIYSFKNNITAFELMTGKKLMMDNDTEYYDELCQQGQKFGGALEFGSPMFLVKDLDLAKNIFVKDFDHFVDRRSIGTDPLLSESLIFLTGQDWKDMRSLLSPTFTSGKIRRMFTAFENSGVKLKNYVKTRFPASTVDGGHVVTMPELNRRFTVDVIGAAGFGMETDALKNAESQFYKMADKTANFNFRRLIRIMILFNFPKLASLLGIHMMDSDVNEFFVGILSAALKERRSSTVKRDDFLQLLVEAGKGNLKVDERELDAFEKEAQLKEDSKRSKMQLNEKAAIAQGFLFFVAGFDTIGNFLNIATYLLAANPDIQEKVFADVDGVMDSCEGKITYEGINRMEYLDMFVSEVMRLYPAVQRLERKCTKEYPIPGTNFVIPKDIIVGIAAEGIHRDPKHYPDPLNFDPERFSAANKANRNPYTYMPFGIGPRNCIGMRFALIESKVAIAHLVHSFKLEPSPKTPIPVVIKKQMGAYKTSADLELRLQPRN